MEPSTEELIERLRGLVHVTADAMSAKEMADLQALVARVTVRNPPFPISIGTTVESARELFVWITWTVPDRDDPNRSIHVRHRVIVNTQMHPDLVLHVVRGGIRMAFDHEYQECLHVDGVRIHDPHAEQIKMAELKAHWRAVNAKWAGMQLTEGI